MKNISHLRFDPCDVRSTPDIGFLEIPFVRVEATDKGEKREILLIQGNEQVAEQGVLNGIVFSKASYGNIFAVVHNNPEIEFQLDAIRPGHDLCDYKIEVHCTHVRSPEYQLVRDRFLVQEGVLNKKLTQLESERTRLQQEIGLMKASKVWKWGQRCKSILGRREV